MIDDVSFQILKILQQKARIPNVEVARQVKMAPSAVLERIRKLENQGYIDGYEVRLNPDRFAKSLVAFVLVPVDRGFDPDAVANALSEIPVVQEIHLVSGEDAFLVKLRTADTADLARVLKNGIRTIEGVGATKTTVVLETVKETARIPITKGDITKK